MWVAHNKGRRDHKVTKKRLIGGYIYSDRHSLPAKGDRPRLLFYSFIFSSRIFSARLFSSLPAYFLLMSSSLRHFPLFFFSLLISAILVLSWILVYIFSTHLRPRWDPAELNRLQGGACTTQWRPLFLSSCLFSPSLVFVCLFIVWSQSHCPRQLSPAKFGSSLAGNNAQKCVLAYPTPRTFVPESLNGRRTSASSCSVLHVCMAFGEYTLYLGLSFRALVFTNRIHMSSIAATISNKSSRQ